MVARRAAALAVVLRAASAPALAQEERPQGAQAGPDLAPIASATLTRPEAPVIVLGSQLEAVQGAPLDELRLVAWQDGALVPIPFQIDERTPEEAYAYEHGELRRGDTDDGRLDANDELVFMARDLGDQVDAAAVALGQERCLELEVRDPRRASGRGWAYLLRYAGPAPARANRRYVQLDQRDGELVGWSGSRVRVVASPTGRNLFGFEQVRFARPEGGYGPDVLDRAKLALRASYLFLDLRRHLDEVRAEVLGYSEGPVRVVASYQLEAYLIWGHWIRSTRRCRLTIYENRLELEAELVLPVALEANRPSELRLSLDFAPEAQSVRVWTSDEPRPLRATGAREARAATSAAPLPEWVCAAFPTGSVLARLRLRGDLEREGRQHRLFLADGPERDPPEDVPGSLGNIGFLIDLSGLPASTYRLELSLHFGPPLRPGLERWILALEDAPLECRVQDAGEG